MNIKRGRGWVLHSTYTEWMLAGLSTVHNSTIYSAHHVGIVTVHNPFSYSAHDVGINYIVTVHNSPISFSYSAHHEGIVTVPSLFHTVHTM